MILIRYAGRSFRDLVMYTVRTGKWWFPVLIVVLAVTATVVTAAKVIVPTVVYTLF